MHNLCTSLQGGKKVLAFSCASAVLSVTHPLVFPGVLLLPVWASKKAVAVSAACTALASSCLSDRSSMNKPVRRGLISWPPCCAARTASKSPCYGFLLPLESSYLALASA